MMVKFEKKRKLKFCNIFQSMLTLSSNKFPKKIKICLFSGKIMDLYYALNIGASNF